MKCRKCGFELKSINRFCPQCGEKVSLYCAECGAELSPETRFCPSCGKPVSVSGDETKEKTGGGKAEGTEEIKETESLNEQEKKVPEMSQTEQERRELQNENNNGVTDPGTRKKKSGLKVVLIAGVSACLVICAAAIGFFLILARRGKELSDYLPLARADVIEWMEKDGLEELAEDFYSKEGITVMLNENGNIDTITLDRPGYRLYDLEVGEKYSFEKDMRKVVDHGYGLMDKSEEAVAFGMLEAGNNLGGDSWIVLQLDGDGRISNIMYTREGAQDMMDAVLEEESGREELWDFEDSGDGSLYEASGKIPETASQKDTTENVSSGNPDEYILPESNSRYLSMDDLAGLDKAALRLARNEIYARHGRKYETEDLNAYFSAQSWYHGYLSAEEFDDSVFNAYEKANLDLIKSAEGIGETNSEDYEGLTKESVANLGYRSNTGNILMEVVRDYDGKTYVIFGNENDVFWIGELNRTQRLDYGGICLMFNGINYVTGEEDYLEVEWSMAEAIDYPTVSYEFDTIGISGAYSYAYMID